MYLKHPMKKILLTFSIASFSSLAQADPEIYGKAFLTTDYVDNKADYSQAKEAPKDIDKSNLQVNSNFSRIGFRGSEAISDTTDIIYQLEYGVQIDGNGGNTTLGSRDTYLGLSNKTFGVLRFGRNTTILGYAYDVMHNRAYWDNLGNTKLDSTSIVSALNMIDYIRQDNSVLWIAPKYKNLQLIMQYAVDESSDSNNSAAGNGYGATLKFDQDSGFIATIAYSKDIEAKGSIDSLNDIEGQEVEKSVNYGGNVIRGALSVDIDRYIDLVMPLKVGALYQQADYDFIDADTEKGLIISSKMDLNNLKRPAAIYLQYNQTDNLNGIVNNQSRQLVLGGEYEFKDNVIAHAYIGQNLADYTDPIDISASVADIKVVAIGGGLEYIF